MRRRALLGTVASSTTLLAGCSGTSSTTVSIDSGFATARPIDDPVVRAGLDSDSDQYVWIRLLNAGDSLPTTDTQAGKQLSSAIAEIGDEEFGLLTNLRTAGAATAYHWPDQTSVVDGRLEIELRRESAPEPVETDEAVGYAFVRYEVDGDVPKGGTVVFPSGATMTVGGADQSGWL